MLCGAGLRGSEAVSLDLSGYNKETGERAIRGAKGRKDRLAYATNGSADALGDWIGVRGSEGEALFCGIKEGWPNHNAPHDGSGRPHILHKRATEARVSSSSPHDLRRSFISDLLDAGADISTAQQLAGHSNVQTTAHYDRRGEATKWWRAAQLLHVPYLKSRSKP
jgi:site-specific recombinase XerD